MWPSVLCYICYPTTDPAKNTRLALLQAEQLVAQIDVLLKWKHKAVFSKLQKRFLNSYCLHVLWSLENWSQGSNLIVSAVIFLFRMASGAFWTFDYLAIKMLFSSLWLCIIKQHCLSVHAYSNGVVFGAGPDNWTHLKPWSHMAGFAQGKMWNWLRYRESPQLFPDMQAVQGHSCSYEASDENYG